MSNKEMLHRKQYRIAAVVAGLALAVSMTACGAQKGTAGQKGGNKSEKQVKIFHSEAIIITNSTCKFMKLFTKSLTLS